MRIIAGSARGRTLKSLKSRALRPTADRVRESIFGVLRERVEGASFLDLYAGAGAVGLEALSRGAASATFVESHRPAGRLIEENARLCGLAERARVIVGPMERALAALRKEGAVFDLVFMDPPYDRGEIGAGLARLGQWPEIVAADGLLIVQRSRHEEPGELEAFRRMRSLRYGETVVELYERRDPDAGS
ncbi:MAG: 16S rRNA (guanine(966)-N(2))-methyltransferase RsmD [Armatimonadota bacterium]